MPPETDFPTDLQALERDYEVIRELGQGGMAAVYLARRRDTNRLVAIKAVRSRYLDDPDALQRFAREARVVADLDHPNIVRTEAIEQIGDRAVAIILEYVAGGTVRDRLREYGAFDAERAETVLRDVANALAYAHRRGIVHRDVKPENVFLDERTGRALLSDFGIARKIDGDPGITQLGAALGTPQYMSPEQIDGAGVDGRTDIYSLGVLGWELLTGRRPWAGENLYGVIYKQKHEELPRITEIRPRVPANLLFAIEGALVKNRAQRWQSVEEFLDRLTYNPPPVLSHAYTPGPRSSEDEPTVRFRSAVPVDAVPREVAAVTSAAPTRAAHVEPARMPASRAARGVLTGRPIMRGLALLVPALIAAGSWYIVFGGSGVSASSSDPNAGLTSSAGSVALDSARAADSTPGPNRVTPPAARVPDTTAAVQPAPTMPEKASRQPASPHREPTRVVRTAQPKAEDPVRPPTVPRPRNAAGSPSPRCAIATTADQRACLLAHIAVDDAALQRVYDSLIVELRRIAGTPRRAPDPAGVVRLRVEQRTWIVQRDRECTRKPARGSVALWAQPLSECFAEMSNARADELGEALARARRQ